MRRIIAPLQLMGCEIKATGDKDTAPLIINGANLENIRYEELPVASAQVKSAILLAGLFKRYDNCRRAIKNTRPYRKNVGFFSGQNYLFKQRNLYRRWASS